MTESSGEPPLGFERVVFFSDAVFAIVITLLVLPLSAEFEIPDDSNDLLQVLTDLGPHIIAFLIGFLVIGEFWMAHHRMFGMIDHTDPGLLALNLLCLLTVCFMPFPTAVLGARHREDSQLPAVFFAASITLVSASFLVIWLYARRRRLLRPQLTSTQATRYTVRSSVTVAVFVLAIGAAFLSLPAAILCWAVLLPLTGVFLSRRQAPVAGPPSAP